MAQFPALPIFTDAYIADTRHLTAAQHGAYLLLLMTAWRMPDCRLPDDDKFLARCASMDLRTWKANRDVVMSFWKKDDQQKFRQDRLLDERKYVDDMSRKNSEAGKASALKRLNRGSTSVATEGQRKSNPHTHTHTPPIPDKNIITPTENILREGDGKKTVFEGKQFFGVEGVGVFQLAGSSVKYNILDHLDKFEKSICMAAGDGWDFKFLVETYNEGVNNGKRQPPNNPAKAFPVWIKKYTKGKLP